MAFHPWALLVALPPMLAIVLLSWWLKHSNSNKREPFNDPLLRPPGESCRQKLMELYDDLAVRMLWLTVPILFSAAMFYSPLSVGTYVVLFVFSLGLTCMTAQRLIRIRRDLVNYQLGFDGERLVGQELSQTLALGCKVYHDLQFETYNIDHVVVAPSGVYAVETKTRRKGHEKGSHRVRYDGHKLIFPEWEDEHGVEQARRNARSLSIFLERSVGERLWVEPILTLPGWLIDRQAKGKVTVLNPKEIISFIVRAAPQVLSPQLIQRISFQIEQRNGAVSRRS